MAHFNNYDHEREKLEEIIQILIWRQFKILIYDGSNEVVQPIVFFINQLRLVFNFKSRWLIGIYHGGLYKLGLYIINYNISLTLKVI